MQQANMRMRSSNPEIVAEEDGSSVSQIRVQPLEVEQRRQKYRQIEEKRVISYLATFVTILWVGSIGMGCQLHDGRRPKYHVGLLAGYDLVFRTMGALLPFLIVIARALASIVIQGKAFPETPTHKNIFYVYMGLTVLRAVVYNIVLAVTGGPEEGENVVQKAFRHQFMSDHVFLAACVMAIVLSEAAILLRIARSKNSASRMRVVAWTLFTVCLLIILFTCCEVFTTARYYHPAQEVMVAAVGGFVLFQLPLGAWTVHVLPYSPGM